MSFIVLKATKTTRTVMVKSMSGLSIRKLVLSKDETLWVESKGYCTLDKTALDYQAWYSPKLMYRDDISSIQDATTIKLKRKEVPAYGLVVLYDFSGQALKVVPLRYKCFWATAKRSEINPRRKSGAVD